MRGPGILLCCWAALAIAVVACGEKEQPASGAADVLPGDPVQAPAPPAVPLEGPLTVEALLAAKRGVKPYDDWAAAWAHLTKAAGPPTRVEGDTHGWYVKVGAECTVLEVVRDAAEQRVDSVLYGPFGAEASQFARCQAP